MMVVLPLWCGSSVRHERAMGGFQQRPILKKKDEEKAREKELQEFLKVAVNSLKFLLDWDQEKLEQVVASKINEYNKNKPNDIVCKFFLEAVEKKQYSWFWTCPNGSTCHYSHALPPGYILRSQMKALLQEETTPMTTELFMQWKQKKIVESEANMYAQRAERAKNEHMSDRELFLADASLFVDDVEAYDKYQREEEPKQKKSKLIRMRRRKSKLILIS
ncbi:hypothetical protein ACS0TY_011216 [Phlomoides rotata]